MGGESFDYKFGNKNNWRRWAWNRMAYHKPHGAGGGVVLYLAGLNDYDREIAISKGFRSHDLIAVECSGVVVDKLRQKKALTINGDILSVLEEWKMRTPVFGVLGDFCGGLTYGRASRLIEIIARAPFLDTVFCLNFLRGRDASSNELRDILKTKNRAEAFFLWLTYYVTYVKDLDLDIRRRARVSLAEKFKPAFKTYMSESGQVFDSVAFKNCLGDSFRNCGGYESVKRESGKLISSSRQSNRIAAILAHRTMRMQAV